MDLSLKLKKDSLIRDNIPAENFPGDSSSDDSSAVEEEIPDTKCVRTGTLNYGQVSSPIKRTKSHESIVSSITTSSKSSTLNGTTPSKFLDFLSSRSFKVDHDHLKALDDSNLSETENGTKVDGITGISNIFPDQKFEKEFCNPMARTDTNQKVISICKYNNRAIYDGIRDPLHPNLQETEDVGKKSIDRKMEFFKRKVCLDAKAARGKGLNSLKSVTENLGESANLPHVFPEAWVTLNDDAEECQPKQLIFEDTNYSSQNQGKKVAEETGSNQSRCNINSGSSLGSGGSKLKMKIISERIDDPTSVSGVESLELNKKQDFIEYRRRLFSPIFTTSKTRVTSFETNTSPPSDTTLSSSLSSLPSFLYSIPQIVHGLTVWWEDKDEEIVDEEDMFLYEKTSRPFQCWSPPDALYKGGRTYFLL